MKSRTVRALSALLALALVAVACSDDDDAAVTADGPEDVTITLMTHDSFALSDETLAAFTADTGIEVRLLQGGDAGEALNQLILTKDDPEADVFFGIDNTFLSRAFDEDLFLAYESPALADIVLDVPLDDEHRVTPIDVGDVCLNYDIAALADRDLAAPATLDDLTDPAYDGTLVVENPATSSPGLAFMLATIAEYGEDGWLDYWQALVDNDVLVVPGWSEAYYGSFTRAEGGDRPIVVSYASSPPAEVFFASEPTDEAPTASVDETCFRQVEYAGIVASTDHPDAAKALVDFMLGDTYQADLPLNQFVFPVTDVELPEVFRTHATLVDDPYTLDPETIAANRDAWIEAWTDVVIR